MRMPTKRNDHKALLSDELKSEHAELTRMAPTDGQVAPEGYEARAKAFNAKCKELGATMCMVVEK